MALASVQQKVKVLDQRMRGVAIGGVRILVGLMWLANLHWKVPAKFGQDTGGGLYKYSFSVTRHSTFAPFTWITEHVVLPHFQLFGWFTLLVETSVAALLLIGYRTKIVALLGASMSIPIFLSVLYYDRSDEWSWSYLLMFGANVMLYAADAGKFGGLDGVLAKASDGARSRALVCLGAVGAVVGLVGLWVARSQGFAGRKVALLGSDAGFKAANGQITRRWELKLLFFNPLWALLTVALGIVLIVGAKQVQVAWVGVAGFAGLAVMAMVLKTMNYQRDDGTSQVISAAPNVAFWGALAVGAAVLTVTPRSTRSKIALPVTNFTTG